MALKLTKTFLKRERFNIDEQNGLIIYRTRHGIYKVSAVYFINKEDDTLAIDYLKIENTQTKKIIHSPIHYIKELDNKLEELDNCDKFMDEYSYYFDPLKYLLKEKGFVKVNNPRPEYETYCLNHTYNMFGSRHDVDIEVHINMITGYTSIVSYLKKVDGVPTDQVQFHNTAKRFTVMENLKTVINEVKKFTFS